MQIKAAVFDVDGTLYPNRLMYIKSVSFFLSYPRFTVHFGRIRSRVRSVRPIHDFQQLQTTLLAESMNITEAEAETFITKVMYREWEECLKGVRTYPRVKEVMHELKDEGVKIGVLSDFPIGRKLAYLGLDELVDYAASAEESGYLKPNPEPFLRVTEALGVPLKETLYVGNHYEYDVLGASRAGMKTAHLSKCARVGSAADFTFSDYGDFMEKFRLLSDTLG